MATTITSEAFNAFAGDGARLEKIRAAFLQIVCRRQGDRSACPLPKHGAFHFLCSAQSRCMPRQLLDQELRGWSRGLPFGSESLLETLDFPLRERLMNQRERR